MTAMHFVISTGISSNMTIPIPHQDGDLSGWNFGDSALQLVVITVQKVRTWTCYAKSEIFPDSLLSWHKSNIAITTVSRLPL